MGQKINSSIFRSGLKNSEWNNKYIEKNSEESTIFLYKNIEIQNYVNNIFSQYGLLVHLCKIEYTYSTANIFISYYDLQTTTHKKINFLFLIKKILTPCLNLYIKNKTINIKTQNLNKKFEFTILKSKESLFTYNKTIKLFKKFLKTPWQKNLIKILFISVNEKNSSKLIANAISFSLTKQKKRHNYILFLLKKLFTVLIKLPFSKIKGVKISIKGRFNGVPRAKKKIFDIGIVPLQSISANINYYNETAYTANGTFGIKVWVCEKF